MRRKNKWTGKGPVKASHESGIIIDIARAADGTPLVFIDAQHVDPRVRIYIDTGSSLQRLAVAKPDAGSLSDALLDCGVVNRFDRNGGK